MGLQADARQMLSSSETAAAVIAAQLCSNETLFAGYWAHGVSKDLSASISVSYVK